MPIFPQQTNPNSVNAANYGIRAQHAYLRYLAYVFVVYRLYGSCVDFVSMYAPTKLSLSVAGCRPHNGNPSAQPKLNLDPRIRFCMADATTSVYITVGRKMPQNYPFPRGSGLLPRTWFLRPTKVHIPNGTSTGSCVLAELVAVTIRHTDHATSELSMGWVDPWVGLGQDFSVFGGLCWVGSTTAKVLTI